MTFKDHIHIRQLKVDCIIGIYPEELQQEQPVIVELKLGMDLSRAGKSGKISHTCDYEQIANEIKALLEFRRYRLLEAAAEEIAAMIFGIHDKIEQLVIRLEKPHALRNLASGAAVEISRNRRDYPHRMESTIFGEAEILLETQDAGLYLLHLHPGKEIPLHYHEVMRELEWRVEGDILRNGQRLEGLAPIAWPLKKRHRYQNTGSRNATLFCCDVPPFIPEDEIVVEEN